MTVETRRGIRLFPDWGHDWPLWEDAHPAYTLVPADLGLSPGLTARLRAWYDYWAAHQNPGEGWDRMSSHAYFLDERHGLAQLLQAEMTGIADVSLDIR